MGKFGRWVRSYLRRDWLEILLTGLGFLFLAMSIFCLVSFIVIAVTFMDEATSVPVGRGLLQVSKGYGLAVFGVGAVVLFLVGWTFAGDAVRRWVRALRRGRSR